MTSHTTEQFRRLLANLPPNVQRQARQAYGLFQKNPDHPSLNFKPIHATRPVYSVRVGRGHRAVGVREDAEIIWFWIGSHAEYDRLIEQWKRR